MHRHQTADSVANRIGMLRDANRTQAFLIVEGGADQSLYTQFACPKRCSVQVGRGRDMTLEAGRLLYKRGFVGFVVAVDQDEWVFNKGHPRETHVVWTDGRDLESTILFAGVAKRVLDELADYERVEEIERDTGKAIIDHVSDWCAPLGAMRWVIVRGRLGLSCKEIDAYDSVAMDSMQLSLDRLADSIISSASPPLPAPRPALKARLTMEAKNLLQNAGSQQWLFCRGHDLCVALASGLRQSFGRMPQCESLTSTAFEGRIRDAYTWSDFENSTLHSQMRSWEVSNSPWRILADRQSPSAALH